MNHSSDPQRTYTDGEYTAEEEAALDVMLASDGGFMEYLMIIIAIVAIMASAMAAASSEMATRDQTMVYTGSAIVLFISFIAAVRKINMTQRAVRETGMSVPQSRAVVQDMLRREDEAAQL